MKEREGERQGEGGRKGAKEESERKGKKGRATRGRGRRRVREGRERRREGQRDQHPISVRMSSHFFSKATRTAIFAIQVFFFIPSASGVSRHVLLSIISFFQLPICFRHELNGPRSHTRYHAAMSRTYQRESREGSVHTIRQTLFTNLILKIAFPVRKPQNLQEIILQRNLSLGVVLSHLLIEIFRTDGPLLVIALSILPSFLWKI